MSTSDLLNFGKDQQGTPAFSIGVPSVKRCVLIAAAGHASFTVPSSPYTKWIMAFGYGSNPDVYVAVNTPAAPPTTGAFTDTGSLPPNVGQINVNAGDIVDVYNNGSSSIDLGFLLYGVS